MTISKMPLSSIILTSGEPAGIGPQLCIDLAVKGFFSKLWEKGARVICLADPEMIQVLARQMQCDIRCDVVDSFDSLPEHVPLNGLCIYPVKLNEAVVPGRMSQKSSGYVMDQLELGASFCLKHRSILVTCPVHKQHLAASGWPNFKGVTHYLGELVGSDHTIMTFLNSNYRVALFTDHIAISDVTKSISETSLDRFFASLSAAAPSLNCDNASVLGINPHSGEDGLLGQEEVAILEPWIKAWNNNHAFKLQGPFAADTAILHHQSKLWVSWYHDQWLPMLKAQYPAQLINETIGLPFRRLSIDHGVALDCALSFSGNSDSLRYVLEYASELVDQ